MTDCRSCELVARRDVGGAPLWDSILRTPEWDVVHAYGTSIEGWLVLVTRRHVAVLAELTDAESAAMGPLLVRVSRALGEVVGCVKTYVAQYAEDPAHPHVHLHVVPRSADQPDELRGPRVFTALGVDEALSVTEQRRDEIAVRLREQLTG